VTTDVLTDELHEEIGAPVDHEVQRDQPRCVASRGQIAVGTQYTPCR
jgi:hypothetical protein